MGMGGGRLSAWLSEWRETYEAYPEATVVTWVELLLVVVLLSLALSFPVLSSALPWTVGALVVALGAAFVVWFTVVRAPVMDRLV